MLEDRLRARFVIGLVSVTLVSVVTVVAWTRGASPLLEVEARIGELRAIADAAPLPLEALVALAWVDARRGIQRSDSERSRLLVRQLADAEGNLDVCFERLVADRVERRMTLDLLRRKAQRWHRLAEL